LAAGHQLKNAEYLADQDAALVLDEDELTSDANRLAKQLSGLLRDPARRQRLGRNLAKFSKPDATREITDLITKQAEK
jgi:UDP-N-acetylglucosamine:LPS N-acetylglucosamine transferase